ncbi:NAD(P)-binding protein [Aulographum hederae CBS 113979]|uniref:NAD(P)-binding protein n=1 Tax=Aulographum hederae CBS 113979 TaxID=1176131 RepID=A0A6G1HCH9_9PEZI|nr:NAD(P)-binding protein [Aulographum hederae CBS 113979]
MAGKVILVTGANRGIGFAIVQRLSQRPEGRDDTYILGVRSLEAGNEAVKELQELVGEPRRFEVLQIDVTDDTSVHTTVQELFTRFGKLDVLINNAGYAAITSPDNADLRQAFSTILSVNVTSIAILTTALLSLLKQSPTPLVINVSSARGSTTRSAAGDLPPTRSVPYSVSKAALNMLTVEMGRAEPGVVFQSACPGFCRTRFNGFKGVREPIEGARVVVELVGGRGGTPGYESGFWHFGEGGMERYPW